MPTRKLVVDYEQDLALFPDRWHKIGLVVFLLLAVIFPTVASEYWLGISLDTMIAIVGAVGAVGTHASPWVRPVGTFYADTNLQVVEVYADGALDHEFVFLVRWECSTSSI